MPCIAALPRRALRRSLAAAFGAARRATAKRVTRSAGVRVVEIAAYHVRIPLRRPIKHASHSRSETDNILIRCVLADGTEGFGEGVPREYVTGETIDSDWELLKKSDLRSQVERCDDFAQAAAMIERLRLPSELIDDRG